MVSEELKQLTFSETVEGPQAFMLDGREAKFAWFDGKYYTLNHPECVRNLIAQVCEQREKAIDRLEDAFVAEERHSKAAERALQNSRRTLETVEHNADKEIAELRAALHAKERELADSDREASYWEDKAVALESELAQARRNHIDANERNMKAEDRAAQARQQAIADLKRELCELAELGAQGNSQPAAFALRRFADVIREFNPSSLTPPPALTPTCIGYEGGCDGNLTGEPHEANCPKFAPPALTKEK